MALVARVGVRERKLPDRVPLEHDQSGLHVDLLDGRVVDGAVLRPADRPQVIRHRRVDRDQGRPLRCELELVQVVAVAVGRADPCDPSIGRVPDHPLADALPVQDPPLPPGEHRLSQVGLGAEVVDAHARGRAVKPDEPAVRVGDHRPVLALLDLRRREDVRRAAGVAAQHRDRRRQEARFRVEVLRAVGDTAGVVRRLEREPLYRCGRLEHDRAVPAGPDQRPVRADRDGLGRRERAVQEEARAAPVRVRRQVARVLAAVRADHADVAQLPLRHAAEADLRMRVGRGGPRGRVDAHPRAGGVRRRADGDRTNRQRKDAEQDRCPRVPCAHPCSSCRYLRPTLGKPVEGYLVRT